MKKEVGLVDILIELKEIRKELVGLRGNNVVHHYHPPVIDTTPSPISPHLPVIWM